MPSLVAAGTARPAVRRMLRDGTAADHARCEELVGPLDDGESYRRFLGAMEVLHAAVLRSAAPCVAQEAVAALRADLARIERDRLDVGGGSPARQHTTALEARSEAEAMGALYVTEGARLGAAVLRRQVFGPLGISPRWGGRFLAAGGAGRRWAAFLEALEGRVITDRDVAEAIAGARAAFEVFRRALAPADLPRAHG